MAQPTHYEEGVEILLNSLADHMIHEEAAARGFDNDDDLPADKRVVVSFLAAIFVDTILRQAMSEGVREAVADMRDCSDPDSMYYIDPNDPSSKLSAELWLEGWVKRNDPSEEAS